MTLTGVVSKRPQSVNLLLQFCGLWMWLLGLGLLWLLWLLWLLCIWVVFVADSAMVFVRLTDFPF